MESAAEVQTRHKDCAVKGEESQLYFSFVTSEVSAYLYITRRTHLCVHYGDARRKVFRGAFVKEKVEILPASVVAGHG